MQARFHGRAGWAFVGPGLPMALPAYRCAWGGASGKGVRGGEGQAGERQSAQGDLRVEGVEPPLGRRGVRACEGEREKGKRGVGEDGGPSPKEGLVGGWPERRWDWASARDAVRSRRNSTDSALQRPAVSTPKTTRRHRLPWGSSG